MEFKVKKELTKTSPLRSNPEAAMTQEFGESYLEYRRSWQDVSAFKYETRTPIHLDFELNYSCNLRCILCPHGIPDAPRPAYSREMLPFELFRQIVDEGASKDLRAVRLNQLNEPLLRSDLETFIAHARKAGVLDVMINTNGMLLTPERSRSLIEAGLTQLRVSLDAATSTTYAQVRCGGDFERVTTNLRNFLRIRNEMGRSLPLVRVSFVRCAQNAHELNAFLEQWRQEADFCAVSDYASWVAEDADSERKFAPSPSEASQESGFACIQPWQRGTVFPNGDFIPCCSEFYRKHPVGNLCQQGLEEIWRLPELQTLREAHRNGKWEEHEICRLCVTMSRPAV